MGGKKGAALNSWLKEFCTLVFIQTIQAFIYAMIISLIVSMSFAQIDDVNDRNASMGIMSVIGLISVFKIEEMVKKIMGVGGTKADTRGAMASLAKTAIAWQFGRKVLDNGAKMLGGAKNIRDASKGRAKLKQRMDRDNALNEGQSVGEDGNDPYREYYDKAKQAKAAGDMDGYHTNMGIAAGMKKAGAKASSGGNSNKNLKDYNEMMDKYQDQLEELKKKKRDGIRQIIQGAGETAGAIPGAIGGAIIGGADGNFDEAMRGLSVGAGLGDDIGGAVSTTTYDLGTAVKSTHDSVAKIRNAVRQQQIDGKGIAKAKNMATAYYKEATKNRVSERELQDIINKANSAHADNAN